MSSFLVGKQWDLFMHIYSKEVTNWTRGTTCVIYGELEKKKNFTIRIDELYILIHYIPHVW